MAQKVVTKVGGQNENEKKSLFENVNPQDELLLYKLQPPDNSLTTENLKSNATQIINAIIAAGGGAVAGHITEIQYNGGAGAFAASPALTYASGVLSVGAVNIGSYYVQGTG